MSAVEISDGIYWVGAIDWMMREFHGVDIPLGTSHNAYLIMDETITLVDTVKAPMAEEMLANIREVCDPADIGLIVSNHAEMDHSGALPRMMAEAPKARLVASTRGTQSLEQHYHAGWEIEAAETGTEISIGKRTLTFLNVPMVHWPDSMFTYVKEDKVLLSNDAFGQHYASEKRFDDEVWGDPALTEAAAEYYATIVLPYSAQVLGALQIAVQLGVEPAVIAPSHGIIWRSHGAEIVDTYRKWAEQEAEDRIAVIYGTMWGSTEALAKAIADGVGETGVQVDLYRLDADPIARVTTAVMRSKAVLIGSPTLNSGVFPQVAGFVRYIEGLKPKGKLWGAFGSYGWAPMATKELRSKLEEFDGEFIGELAVRFVPDAAELGRAREWGKGVAERLG
jgi:flavorubredoxin